MPTPIKKGDRKKVSVELKFEGTFYNHIILVENDHVPTKNNEVKNGFVVFDGDPLTVIGRFRGEPGSKIKKFEVKINGYTRKHNDIVLKTGEVEIKDVIPYAYFDLKEA